MTDAYLGVDPGQSGAVALIDMKRNILFLGDYPGDEIQAAKLISKLKEEFTIIHAIIEKAQAMPKQGVSSMFKFGTNYGAWLGILASFQIPFQQVRPQLWQKGVISKAQDKKPAMAAAGRMFPTAEIYGPRGGKKDGRADALLIADLCRRQFIGAKIDIVRQKRRGN